MPAWPGYEGAPFLLAAGPSVPREFGEEEGPLPKARETCFAVGARFAREIDHGHQPAVRQRAGGWWSDAATARTTTARTGSAISARLNVEPSVCLASAS